MKDIIKLLKNIGVDTRYISYTPDVIYINNLRFSKFSRQKEETFKKYYPEIEVRRSSLLQKICNRSSKLLSKQLKPRDKVLIPKICDGKTRLIHLILEPYTRKYGICLTEDKNENVDKIIGKQTLDIEAYEILSCIFAGEGIPMVEYSSPLVINPLLHVPNDWINSFINEDNVKYPSNKYKNVTLEFMEFLEPIIPSYKENILQSREFIQENQY